VIPGTIVAFPHYPTCFKEIFLSAFRNGPFVSEKPTQYFASRIQRRFEAFLLFLDQARMVNMKPD
jgi:hypothetical protein